jgi:hypothetical protein
MTLAVVPRFYYVSNISVPVVFTGGSCTERITDRLSYRNTTVCRLLKMLGIKCLVAKRN